MDAELPGTLPWPCSYSTASSIGAQVAPQSNDFAVGKHLSGRAIDLAFQTTHDGRMAETVHSLPRRSQRVFHRMRVQAQGRAHNGRKFRETCETQVVNTHGGLLVLKNEVDNGELIVLTNPETQEDQECRIVFVGEPGARGQRIGIEFLTPAPRFWGIDFETRTVSDEGASEKSC